MTFNDSIIVAMIASIPPTITAVASLLASLRNYNTIRNLHREVNGRMGLLLETTEKAAHSAGKLEQVLADKELLAEVIKADKIRKEEKDKQP